jgi:integrase
MFITCDMWPSFSTYLFIDKKLSSGKASTSALRSRFLLLCKYFYKKEFTRENFNQFLQEKLTKGHKHTYINGFIKVAKHIDKFLKINTLQDYTYFPEEQEYIDILTTDEIRAIAECPVEYQRDADYQAIRNRAFIYFIAMTGCRVSEAIMLEWKDVVTSPIPIAVFRKTKNKDVRAVPLRGELHAMVMSIPQRSHLVFDIVDDSHITSDLHRRVEAIHLTKRVWWHLFRHSFITELVTNKRIDSILVAQVVGHKRVTSTMRYNHANLIGLAGVIDTHPIFQQHQILEDVTKGCKEFVERFINKARFSQSIEESSTELTIRIKKAYI